MSCCCATIKNTDTYCLKQKSNYLGTVASRMIVLVYNNQSNGVLSVDRCKLFFLGKKAEFFSLKKNIR